MLGPGAAASARQLAADLLKLLLVVGPHELIEACGEGRGLGLQPPHGVPTDTSAGQPGTLVAPRLGPSSGQPLLAKAPRSRLCFLGSSAKRGPR